MLARETRIDWVEAVLDTPPGSGWSVSYEAIRAGGYPYRVDITINDLTIRNAQQGITWHLPRVQLLTLSYQFDHVIIALPPQQEMTLDGARFTLRSDNMKASVTTDGAGAIIETVIIEAERVRVAWDSGPIQTVDNPLLAVQHDPANPGQYRLSLASHRAGTPPEVAVLTRRGPLLARLLLGMTFEGQVMLSQPFGASACREGGIVLEHLALQEMTVSEQDVDIDLAADIGFTTTGRPEGWVDVRVNSIRNILDLLSTLDTPLDGMSGRTALLIKSLGDSVPGGGVGFRAHLERGAVQFLGFKLIDVPPVQPLC